MEGQSVFTFHRIGALNAIVTTTSNYWENEHGDCHRDQGTRHLFRMTIWVSYVFLVCHLNDLYRNRRTIHQNTRPLFPDSQGNSFKYIWLKINKRRNTTTQAFIRAGL